MAVYLIEAVGSGKVKIGYSVDVRNRLKGIKSGCPFEVKVLFNIQGDMSLERRIHKKFEEFRVDGTREWFQKRPEIIEFFEGKFVGAIEKHNGLPLFRGTLRYPVSLSMTWDGLEYFGCRIEFECPRCGDEISHGWSPHHEVYSTEHRASHCECWRKGGYYITCKEKYSANHDIDPESSHRECSYAWKTSGMHAGTGNLTFVNSLTGEKMTGIGFKR